MANNSDDLRRLMNLMESYQQPKLVEGWVDRLQDKLDRRLGEKERQKMANELSKEYYTWLGHSNRAGTLEDLERFMTHRVGFNDNDIKTVFDNAGLNEPSGGSEEPEAEADADTTQDKKIARGHELDQGEEPEAKKGWDPEEGTPIPDDLNTKLSDYKDIGQEPADDETDPGEIEDDPRKYKASNGDWDRKKISKKLASMPKGAKLTLGSSTFRRVSKDDAKDYVDARESIQEADEAENDSGVIDRAVIKNVMDAAAAQVNDAYLYNGPERDKDHAKATAPRGSGSTRTGDASPNVPGKAGSGRYDAKEMFAILKTDFEKGPAWVESVTRKVMNAKSISEMTNNDMDDLALLGWALVRARN